MIGARDETRAAEDGGDDGEPVGDYAAWRERMRRKSERNREFIDLTAKDPASAADPPPGAGYWDPEDLFRDSDRVAREEADHLAVLDLRADATATQITAAYRGLAKVHHPDRWSGAEPGVRRHHEQRMAAVNEAYAALKARQRV